MDRKQKAFFFNFNKTATPAKIVFVFFVFLLAIALYFSHFTPLSAQTPANTTIDCGSRVKPLGTEFQTTRPYQKNVECNASVSETSLYCGNSLILSDEVTVEQTADPSSDPDCELLGGGKYYRCNYTVNRQTSIAIDLSDANLPILGNSELVKNSQNYNSAPDGGYLTDAEKVNEYVNWYLRGTLYTAEENKPNPKNEEDINRIINYSGPLRKLLPQAIIQKNQIETIEAAGETQHNQVVTCGGNGMGEECYKGLIPYNSQEKTIKDWNEDLNLERKIPNLINDLLSRIGLELAPELLPWNHRYPPLPFGKDMTGDRYFSDMDEIYFQKAYNEWRGNSCIIVRIPFTNLKKLFCFDNPAIKNEWSDLFPYIPLSSHEDRKGQVYVDSSGVTANDPNVEISDVSLDSTPADLYFAHTEEVADLGNLLQSTIKPESANKAVSRTGTNSYSSSAPGCYLLNIRSNPGDDLFAGEIKGDLSYTAKFYCDYLTADSDSDRVCTKNTSISLSVKTKTPKVEEVWNTLVAGSASIFKRIFPKIGENSPILGLLDIPGATSVTYSGDNLVSATNPSERSDVPAELYFPHLGGIDEYFLKGIQTALRPKGYGEPILSAAPNSMCQAGGNAPDLSGATCSLKSSAASFASGIPPTLIRLINSAATSYKVPPSLILGVMFAEGDFNMDNSGNYTKFDWTESNVQEMIKEGACMGNCDPNTFPSYGPVPFVTSNWNDYKNAIQVVAPGRKTNPCNLADGVFALAMELRSSASGNSGYLGKTCFGIQLNPGVAPPDSCSWGDTHVETAIKGWEMGGSLPNECWTQINSCNLGGIGTCSTGGDTCETVRNRYDRLSRSHNGCIWDTYKEN